MFIARILYPVQVLGPGDRIAIWVSGCPHHCEGCANPELWEQKQDQNISMDTLLDLVERIAGRRRVDGFTITGGEPFFQPEALAHLVRVLSAWSEDILVFSGYYRQQIEAFASLEHIAVLVDGPYVRQQNFGLTLRGSANQSIHILKPEFEERYRLYLQDKYSKVQNFLDGNSVISVGIHKPDFASEITARMQSRGLMEGESDNGSVHTEVAQGTEYLSPDQAADHP